LRSNLNKKGRNAKIEKKENFSSAGSVGVGNSYGGAGSDAGAGYQVLW
jgi:hypothetical protein